MYRDTKHFLTPQTEPERVFRRTPHDRVARAIFKGVKKKPKQAFGALTQGDHAACVIGTAYVGGIPPASPLWATPVVSPCPCRTRKTQESLKMNLQMCIIHLNDKHHWKREVIAEWLLTVD